MSLPPTLLRARAALDSGELTATRLLRGLVRRVEAMEPQVRSMVTVTVDRALEQASRADGRLAAGERGPLIGIPVVVKDLVDVAGLPTTAGSAVLADNLATTDAEVWVRLEAAGAVLVGKANTHEFAYGGTTEPTRNPADTSRIVGGSSGGPAAALAAGFCLGAVGTDTAGSIRIPANLCGVAGLKPTRGLVPADGVVPLSTTLDAVGPMARSVADLAPLLQVLAGAEGGRHADVGPTRVGVLTGTGMAAASVSAAVAATAAALTALEVEVVDVTLSGFAAALAADFDIIGYEATAYHRRWAEQRDQYTPYVRERLDAAAEVTRERYDAALATADSLSSELDHLLEDVDVLLVPGVPFPASPAYDDKVLIAGEWEDRDAALCRNAAFVNLTGHPALAVPAGLDGLLPVGVQLVGRHGADLALVELGARLERLLPAALPAHLRG